MPEQLKSKNICPMLKKECIGHDCKWYMQLSGTHPQDATKLLEGWDCAINWQVWAQLEIAKRVTGGLDGVQKATESFRNEVVIGQIHQRMTLPASPATMMIEDKDDESINQ